MLSRVADNLYWFARYVRRAENTARLVGVGSQLQLDLPRSVRFAWRPMIDTVGAGEIFAAHFPEAGPQLKDLEAVHFLLLDPRNPSSLRRSIPSSRMFTRSVPFHSGSGSGVGAVGSAASGGAMGKEMGRSGINASMAFSS